MMRVTAVQVDHAWINQVRLLCHSAFLTSNKTGRGTFRSGWVLTVRVEHYRHAGFVHEIPKHPPTSEGQSQYGHRIGKGVPNWGCNSPNERVKHFHAYAQPLQVHMKWKHTTWYNHCSCLCSCVRVLKVLEQFVKSSGLSDLGELQTELLYLNRVVLQTTNACEVWSTVSAQCVKVRQCHVTSKLSKLYKLQVSCDFLFKWLWAA